MAYEVPTGPVRRTRRSILVPPLIALAIVAAAVVAGPPPVPGPLPTDSPTPTAATPAPLAAGVTDCGELRALACRDTVRAAQLALDFGHPAIASATAWRSLVCGNDFDCPRGTLEGARPAGSVVFAFVDGSAASVNVLWVDVSSRRFEDGTERLMAYVVRWFGPGA